MKMRSPHVQCLTGRSRKGNAVMVLAGRIVLVSAVLVIAACVGPGAQKTQVPAPMQKKQVHSKAPATVARPSATAGEHRTPSIQVVDPGHYEATRKQRTEALSERSGNALAPKGVGYYMEVLEAKLRQSTAGTTVSAVLRGENIVIGPIEDAFAKDGTQFADGVRGMLALVAPVLTEFSKTLITIRCYTDSSGAADYNRTLSEQRGLAVARYLVNAGVDAARILVVGYGESEPVASNATVKGRARNRRVGIELTPLAH
ncbi:MAG: OmpA family protein [Gammaproteobacteria bacterium]